MTCVVAVKRKSGSVVMGADSAGVAGISLQVRQDPKIYRVGEMLIGFTTSFRMGQLLGYSLVLPQHHPDVSVDRYLSTLFVDAVRGCLKTGGYADRINERESAGQFIVAYRGRIFTVDSDYQVGETREEYAAVGCGVDLALGALYACRDLLDGAARVRLALEAAAHHSSSVREPFVLLELTP